MNKLEVWKDIPGFENYYEISNYGEVISKDRIVVCSNGRKLHLKPHKMRIFYPDDSNGSTRPRVELNRNNNFTTIYIPNMIGHIFNGWAYESSVYYKDNDPHNNYVGNLTQDYHEAGWYDDGKIWKPVVGYEGIYEISSDGCLRTLSGYRPHSKLGHQVRNVKVHEFRENSTMRYISIGLYKNGKCKECLVHRLVAEAFIPNPDNLPKMENARHLLFKNWHGDEFGDYQYGVLSPYISNPETLSEQETLEDIKKVKGIGDAKFEKIKDLITV